MATATFVSSILLLTLATGIRSTEQNSIASEPLHISINNDESSSRIGKSLVDRIVDLALEKLKTTIIEPIVLQDEVVIFNKTVLSIPLRGELALYNGELRGTKTIERSGDAHYHYHNLHELDVNCSFYFEKLTFQYDFQANIYKRISTDGRVNGYIQQLVADANLDIDVKNRSIELTSLTLRKAESINVSLDSEKFLDKLINLIIKMFTSNFKTTILSQIQKQLQSLLRQKFYYKR